MDDDCPCGTGCELGVCEATCTGDDDCTAGRCDDFGRCRSTDDEQAVSQARTTTGGSLVASESMVYLGSRSGERIVTMTVVDAFVPRARVAAGPAVLVSCGASGVPGPECILENLSVGQQILVHVTAGPAEKDNLTVDPSALQITVHDGTGVDTVGVSLELPPTVRPPSEVSVLRPGVYDGVATLIEGGIVDGANLEMIPDGLGVPVTVTLHGTSADTAVMEISEPTTAFAASGRWVGSVTGIAASAPVLDLPTTPFVSSSAWAATGPSIDVRASVAPTSIDVSGDNLGFDVPMTLDGILGSGRSPRLTWRVSVSRTGELPLDTIVPTVPDDATGSDPAARTSSEVASNLNVWEAAARNAIARVDVTTLGVPQRLALLANFSPVGAGQLGDMRACRLDASGLDRLALLAVSDTWSVAYETLRTPSPPAADGLHALAQVALAPWVANPAELDANLRVVPPVSLAGATAMPCDVTFAMAAQPVCAGATPPVADHDLGAQDRCDRMAAAYGCSVEQAPGGQTFSVTVQLANGTDLGLSAAGAAACGSARAVLTPTTLVGTVQRVCRLPVVAQGCAEFATCASRPTAPGDGSVESRRFALSAPVDTSGDLLCGGGGRTFAASDVAPLTAQSLIDECAADWSRIRSTLPNAGVTTGNPRLNEVFDGGAACIDFARAVTALGFATEADRQRGVPTVLDTTPVASRVAQRILQRLAQQLAFTAREAAQRENLAAMIRASGAPPPPGAPTLESADVVLERLLPFWDVVLHPRFATAFDAMSGASLAAPDYRDAVVGSPVPSIGDSIDTAVMVDLLELASAQLDLVTQRLYWAALDRDMTALGSAGKALRYSLAVRTLVHGMTARARAAAGATPPPWSSRYTAALADLDARGARVIAAIGGIVNGDNPLGIEEEDLPVYYFDSSATPAERYFAVSDYLLGPSSWLPPLVARADASFSATLTGYYSQLARDVQVRRDNAQLSQALTSVRLDYGQRLAAICMPSGSTVANVLDSTTFSPDTCYRNVNTAGCGTGNSVRTDITLSELERYLCVVGKIRKHEGHGQLHGDDATAVMLDFGSCANPRYPVVCTEGSCLSCDADADGTPPARVIPFNPWDFHSLRRPFADAPRVSASVVDQAEAQCDSELTVAAADVSARPERNGDPAAAAACFNGSLGEAVFAVRSASAALAVARSELLEHSERHRIALRSCRFVHKSAQEIEQAQQALTEYLNGREIGIAVARNVADIADAVGNCAQITVNFDTDNPTETVTDLVSIGVGCVAYGLGAVMKTVANSLEADMNVAQNNFDAFQAMTLNDGQNEACKSDAALELVGARSASERVAQALVELESAALRVDNLKRDATSLFNSGRAAVAAMEGTNVPPLAHDLWTATQLSDAWNDMRLARRVTYLAVRAVEYEVQQSLGERDAVLRARLPADLARVLTALRTLTAARQVNGRPPSDLKVVLSLRDDILQVGDHSEFDTAEHRADPVERFRILLTSPRYAEYGANGAYLGQRIPFSLLPLGQIGLGRTNAIPVLTGSDCGERLWAANATILGPADMLIGSNSSMTRIDLRKQNTFASQWCGSLGTGRDAMQFASVRPSRNLFADPTFQAPSGVGGSLGLGNEATQEASARIEPHFNVSRVAFEDDSYGNGSTTELAGRGLYGDYALFIPAAMISRDGSNGLVLQSVEDILIRLDYVSVAR